MDGGFSILRATLERLELATESSASGWRLLLYATVLTPVAIAGPTLMFGADVGSDRFGWALRAFMGAAFGLMLFALYYGWRLRQLVRRQLEQSDIAQRIATGELWDDPIFELTPWPWRLLLPQGRLGEGGQNLYPILQRVAWNLDWYLRPAKRLWRWQWIYYILLLPASVRLISLLINFLAHLLSMRVWHDTLLGLSISTVIVAAILILLPLPFLKFRRQVWTEELVRHLRTRLEA